MEIFRLIGIRMVICVQRAESSQLITLRNTFTLLMMQCKSTVMTTLNLKMEISYRTLTFKGISTKIMLISNVISSMMLYRNLNSIALKGVESVYKGLNPSKRQHMFEIFGLDFILDENLRPYLLEMNTNP